MRRGRFEAAEGRHFRTLFELGAAGTLSDGQLLERFAARGGAGGELAFAALVERHGPMVLRVARSALGDEHAALDAFQMTFLILARKGSSLWVRDSIGPWLHSVARRVASRARLAEGRRRRTERAAARPESAPRPESDPDRAELARILDEEIARLPAPFRSAVVACHLEGLTQHEAARRLGWPVGTLQSRLDRARRRLRDRLARRGYAPTLLPPPPIPLPDALILATSRLAVTSAGTATASAGPAVLALMELAAKGLTMTPWKIAAALLAAGSLAASGVYLAAPTARATDGPAAGTPQAPADPQAKPKAQDVDIHGFKFPAPLAAASGKPPKAEVPAIPEPADGPGSPVLLAFYNRDSIRENVKSSDFPNLTRAGYPIQDVAIKGFEDVQAVRYKVTSTMTFVLVDAEGSEIARHVGDLTPPELARFYNDRRPKAPPQPAPPQADEAEPALNETSQPRPWETVVRIKMHWSSRQWGFGSGTIVHSDDLQSIILTCAHIFKLKGQRQPGPKEFRVPIRVDLFDGRLAGPKNSMVGCVERDIVGEAIDYDFNNDVGLIRIRPGRRLPASRVVPEGWEPRNATKMYTVGCSHGNDATAWDTRILDPRVSVRNPQTDLPFFEIKCANRPLEGRAGGGLFTTDGYLAGVCNLADPNENVGLYAPPEAIRKILHRNGLSMAFGEDPNAHRAVNIGDTIVFPYAEIPAAAKPPGTRPAAPGGPEPNPAPPVSDVDRRLAELERKLDRVVEALENLGAGKKPEGPIGDFGRPPRPRSIP